MLLSYEIVTKPPPVQESGLVAMGFAADSGSDLNSVGGLAEPEGSASLAEPEGAQTAEPAAGAPAQARADEAAADSVRSEERRVGKDCVSKCRSRCSQYP